MGSTSKGRENRRREGRKGRRGRERTARRERSTTTLSGYATVLTDRLFISILCCMSFLLCALRDFD